jgi:hypothetical protein
MIELLISVTLLMIITGITMQTFRRSSALLVGQGGRLEAQQNGRFATTSLERELRMAGVGTVASQPIVVQATATSITFNVDLLSRTIGDVGTVYVDTSADTNAVAVLTNAHKISLPVTGTSYPDSTYLQTSGVPSGAETISYYLAKDSTSSLSNQYVLWRRVNATTPRVVARGIRYNVGDTVFQYFKGDTTGALTAIPSASLPLFHTADVHNGVADTGKYALIDSIRTVRLRLTAVYRDPKAGDVLRNVITTVRIMNAGLVNSTTCGSVPMGVAVTFTTSIAGASPQWVKIAWPRSGDEGAGEKDVERYAVFKRPDSVATFDTPFVSIPAGPATYTYTDNTVHTGQKWYYGVTAQDCTPSSSPVGSTAKITIP